MKLFRMSMVTEGCLSDTIDPYFIKFVIEVFYITLLWQ